MIKQLQTLDSKHIPNLMDWCLEKAQKIIQKRLNFLYAILLFSAI